MKQERLKAKQAELLKRKEQIREETRKAKIAAARQIDEEGEADLGKVDAELGQIESQIRALEREMSGKMAIELGLFLLRDGLESAKVKPILKSREFDEFMRGGRASKRKLFGLPPIAEKPKRQATPAK